MAKERKAEDKTGHERVERVRTDPRESKREGASDIQKKNRETVERVEERERAWKNYRTTYSNGSSKQGQQGRKENGPKRDARRKGWVGRAAH